MRIAITSTGPDLTASVDPRFGRCPYFLFVETDDLSVEVAENPNLTLGGGAGIQSAQLMAEHGVQHVLTGNCGPNAHQTLSAAGIGVIIGCSGTVRDVVEQYKAGQFAAADAPNVASHFGMGTASLDVTAPPAGANPTFGPGMGQGGGGMGGGGGRGGRGMGRGMGMGGGGGRGRGMGGGMGRGQGMVPGGGVAANPSRPPTAQAGNELSALKQQAQAMGQQMQQVQQRIQELEQGTTMAARVDQTVCTGCGACVDVCPVDAIRIPNGKAQVAVETCIACGVCVAQCPVGAIAIG